MSQVNINEAKTIISNSIAKIKTPQQRVKNATIYELFHIFIENEQCNDDLLSDKIKNCTSKLSLKFYK